jgi:hypothetical protein
MDIGGITFILPVPYEEDRGSLWCGEKSLHIHTPDRPSTVPLYPVTVIATNLITSNFSFKFTMAKNYTIL